MNIVAIDYSMATKSFDIFVSGCAGNPRCEGCHNPESWDFSCGKEWKQWLFQINNNIKRFGTMIDKFFILGGEPLDQDPQELLTLIDCLREYKKEIWLFTRYEMDEIASEVKEKFDYIKTGPYKQELSIKDYCVEGVVLATSNQTIHKRGRDY